LKRRVEAALLFAALGDETRLALVQRLADGEAASITALASGFAVTRQAVTKHLVCLEEAGLVVSAKAGRETVWTLRATRLAEAQRYLDAIGRGWERRLARLRTQLEG